MVRLAQLVEFMAVMVEVAVSNPGGAGGTQEFLRKFAKSGKIKGPPFDL